METGQWNRDDADAFAAAVHPPFGLVAHLVRVIGRVRPATDGAAKGNMENGADPVGTGAVSMSGAALTRRSRDAPSPRGRCGH